MKTMYKLLLLFFLIPIAITATDKNGKFTKNKIITKEFKVTNNAFLNVTNKYGNIDIVTWNENTISIKVSITTKGDNEEKVKDRLNEISVDFSGNSSEVSAKTIIEKTSNSWNLWGKNNNVNMEINYQIKMPIANNVNLNNDYGGISIDKLEGSSKINCDYGKLNIGDLLGSDNQINIDYTNNSTIQYIKDGSINADYSKLHVEKAGKIKLNADYSHLSFGMIVDLFYNCDYGDLKINSIGNLRGNCDYMNITVNKLSGSGEFGIEYGSLKISEISSNFKLIKVQSSYSHLKFGLNNTNSFNIDASLNYAGFKGLDGFTFNKEIKNNNSKYYEGFFNKQNSNALISVKSSYGSLTFTTN